MSRAVHALLLLATLLVAGFLRFDGLGEPSLWLDEILHHGLTTKAAAAPWWQWITGLEAENGPLYYATQLAARVAGSGEFAARLPAALFGLAAVLIIGSRNDKVSGAAAILLALSPLHVYYSREARPYALLVLLTAGLVVTLLRGRSLAAAVLLLLAMTYTAAVAAPVLAAAAMTAALCALLDREKRRWYATVAAAAALLAALSPLLYRGAAATQTVTNAPSIDGPFLAMLARNFAVTALETPRADVTAIAMFVFALIGAVALLRRDRRAATIVIGMTILPAVIAIAALLWFDHWYAVRYVTPSLIGYVLLAGAGIAAVGRIPAIALVLAAGFAIETWPAARTEPFRKLDWRGIAQTIDRYAGPDDLVIAAEPWSEVSLRHYLDPRLELAYIFAPEVANVQRQLRPATWLVTAGFNSQPATRIWMCRYPLLLASPVESFRLHYASRNATQVLNYADGWAAPEAELRWAIATRATLIVPRWGKRDDVLRMRVLPHGAQTMRVTLNGHVLGFAALPGQWSEQSFAAPARFWIDGENVIAFDFSHATTAPNDPRTLAVAFAGVNIGGPLTRITALIEPHHRETRLQPLRKDAVIPMLNRLGLDPNLLWSRLARGELFLDDVLDTLTWGADCQTEQQFVETAIRVLLERPARPHELRELAALPRDRAIGRIAKWDEFRGRVLAR